MTTIYRVLENDLVANSWVDRGSFNAGSPEGAIRAYVAESGEGGTFAAVPARSFKPVTLQVERVAKVKIIGAEGEGS